MLQGWKLVAALVGAVAGGIVATLATQKVAEKLRTPAAPTANKA